MTSDGIEIALVGVGGIGSNLAWALVPAIHRGALVESIGPVRVRIFDSDVVSEANLSHQRFSWSDVGMPKVKCVRDALSDYESENLSIEACLWDVRSPEDLGSPDLTVVGVDSSPARMAVHKRGGTWLDLRCVGETLTSQSTAGWKRPMWGGSPTRGSYGSLPDGRGDSLRTPTVRASSCSCSWSPGG